MSGSGRRYKGDQSAEGASRWAPSDFPAVVLLVLGAVVLGLLLSRMAFGGNMKGQAMLAIAPWAVAVFVSARARRSPWSYSQRLILHVVLAGAVVLVWGGLSSPSPDWKATEHRSRGRPARKASLLHHADGS